MPGGEYGGNPGGFLVHGAEKKFYYSGDTCLMMDMQLIPRYAKLDFAILPIGGNFTMDVEDAVIAAEFIQCDKIIGVHFDTFGYIKIDHEQAIERFRAAGKELILPEIGKTITFVKITIGTLKSAVAGQGDIQLINLVINTPEGVGVWRK